MCVGIDRLVEPLKATVQSRVKANSVKQEFEKQEEIKRSAIRTVAALLEIPDAGVCVCTSAIATTHSLAVSICMQGKIHS